MKQSYFLKWRDLCTKHVPHSNVREKNGLISRFVDGVFTKTVLAKALKHWQMLQRVAKVKRASVELTHRNTIGSFCRRGNGASRETLRALSPTICIGLSDIEDGNQHGPLGTNNSAMGSNYPQQVPSSAPPHNPLLLSNVGPGEHAVHRHAVYIRLCFAHWKYVAMIRRVKTNFDILEETHLKRLAGRV